MKKVLLMGITLLGLIYLGSCQMFENLVEIDTYMVTFETGDGLDLTPIEVKDYTERNFNTSNIPSYKGHTFEGWFLDEALVTAYVTNQDYEADITLYAKWRVTALSVEILDTHSWQMATYTVDYGSTLSDMSFTHEGLIFKGFKFAIDDLDFLLSTPVTSNLSLYTVYDTKDGYHKVTFETGDATRVSNQMIISHNELTIPNYPVHETMIFAGWYVDENLTTLYDFDSLVTTDFTLYAKFMDPSTWTYEIEDTTLTWTSNAQVLNYALYIIDEPEPFIVTEADFVDLKTYGGLFLEETQMYVEATFISGVRATLFDMTLLFYYEDTLYQENFEDELFLASTSYSNSVNPKLEGPAGYQYNILNGAVSKTIPIEGTKSVQLRKGSSASIPYLETAFTLERMNKLIFIAKSLQNDLVVKFINEFGNIEQSVDIKLTSVVETYTIDVISDVALKIRFELVPTTSATTGEQVSIDDIKVFSDTGARAMIKVISDDVPDINLDALIARYAEHRSKLAPPGFNALSNVGLTEYYASLNGLTGAAFKLELTNILTTTHRRLIKYDEARFILEQSDLVTTGTTPYLDGIYSNHEIIPYWDGGKTWAREHVWPNSRLGIPRVSGSSTNQGADVHNLRAINPGVNSSRSNRYFVDGEVFGLVGSKAYYPGDTYKGDVARILFYMLARYPDILSLVDGDIIDSSYNPEGAVMGILSMLIEWHNSDPVSPFEIHRNNTIYSYQGNRNPFIDNPAYADIYFS